jgi:hypothetical protein
MKACCRTAACAQQRLITDTYFIIIVLVAEGVGGLLMSIRCVVGCLLLGLVALSALDAQSQCVPPSAASYEPVTNLSSGPPQSPSTAELANKLDQLAKDTTDLKRNFPGSQRSLAGHWLG